MKLVLVKPKHTSKPGTSHKPLVAAERGAMEPVQSLDRDCAEKTLREAMTMRFFCHAHPLTSLRNILRKQKVVTSSNLRRMRSGATVRVSGLVILVHTPPTKSRKRVMFLTLEDEAGLFEVVVFSKAQDRFAKLILTSEVLTLEGRLQRQGPTGLAISVIMEKALVGLCGSLVKLLGYVMQTRIERQKRVVKNPGLKRIPEDCEDTGLGEQLTLVFREAD